MLLGLVSNKRWKHYKTLRNAATSTPPYCIPVHRIKVSRHEAIFVSVLFAYEANKLADTKTAVLSCSA